MRRGRRRGFGVAMSQAAVRAAMSTRKSRPPKLAPISSGRPVSQPAQSPSTWPTRLVKSRPKPSRRRRAGKRPVP